MRHHLEVLEKNRMITSIGDRYGATYFLSQTLEENYSLFEEIVKKSGKSRKRSKIKRRNKWIER